MKTNDLLANVGIASPCHARWGHMVGDERARFCRACSKHVYNLSAMTAEAATALIREKEGQLCARFYQRADGTVLTADCSVGVARGWGRLRSWISAGATAAIMAFFGVGRGQAAPGGEVPTPGKPLKPNLVPGGSLVMGVVCLRPPATNAPVKIKIPVKKPVTTVKANLPPVKR